MRVEKRLGHEKFDDVRLGWLLSGCPGFCSHHFIVGLIGGKKRSVFLICELEGDVTGASQPSWNSEKSDELVFEGSTGDQRRC